MRLTMSGKIESSITSMRTEDCLNLNSVFQSQLYELGI